MPDVAPLPAIVLSALLAAACTPDVPDPPRPAPGNGGLVLDRDEREEQPGEPEPFPVGREGSGDGAAPSGGAVVRCAVIVGDDVSGVGPKDARDFQAALQRLPEWRPPAALYRTIFAGATRDNVATAITDLHDQGCLQLVFFYSGHGSNRRGDLKPEDEAGLAIKPPDEYLSLRNDDATSEDDLEDDRRIFDDDLGGWLRNWQVANRFSRPVAGGAGQFVWVYPDLLVILHACRSGGFVGGSSDLDVRLLERFEILMSTGENQLCYARPAADDGTVFNSVFVTNILAGMDIATDRAVTGKSLFEGADDETTDEAERICTRPEGCAQNPRRFTSMGGDGTITLHAGP